MIKLDETQGKNYLSFTNFNLYQMLPEIVIGHHYYRGTNHVFVYYKFAEDQHHLDYWSEAHIEVEISPRKDVFNPSQVDFLNPSRLLLSVPALDVFNHVEKQILGLVLEKDGSSLEPPRDNYTEIGQILTIAKANEIGQIILIVNLVEIGLFEIVKVAEIAVAELEIAVLNVEVGLHVEEMTPHDQHWTNDDEGFTMDVARQHALDDD